MLPEKKTETQPKQKAKAKAKAATQKKPSAGSSSVLKRPAASGSSGLKAYKMYYNRKSDKFPSYGLKLNNKQIGTATWFCREVEVALRVKQSTVCA